VAALRHRFNQNFLVQEPAATLGKHLGPPMPAPSSAKALVPFVSVKNMTRLVRHVGVEAMLIELT
jgi:hypothetical protein